MSYNYISHQCNLFEYKYSLISSKINFEHNIFPFYYWSIKYSYSYSYDDKYRHTRDRLFGLVGTQTHYPDFKPTSLCSYSLPTILNWGHLLLF
jgi:hypothetical protein